MDNLYTKYGSGSSGGIAGLQASQTATANSFKDVLTSVGDLQKSVEKSYIADNTSKLQEYLKQNIRSAGLGADAPEMDDISRKFGKLIDTNVLGQTINSTREKMVGDAKSSAEQEAGKTFGETDDLIAAGQAFRAKLEAQGMKPAVAAEEESKWRGANKFRAEDVANQTATAIDDFSNEVLDITRSFGQGASRPDASPETVINTLAEGLPTKLRGKAIDAARTMIAERSKLTPEQQDLYDNHKKLVANRVASLDQEQAMRASAAAAEVEKYGSFLSPSTKEKGKSFADSPGGFGDYLAEDASNFWTGAGKLDGKEVPTFIMPQVLSMIDKDNIPTEDAYAIGLQAYQDAKASGGQALFGSGASIVKSTLAERLMNYRDKYVNLQAAKRAQTGLLANGLTQRAKLVNEGDTMLQEIKTGEGLSNINGAAYDSTARFKKSIFSPDYVAPTSAPAPGSVPMAQSHVTGGTPAITPTPVVGKNKKPAEALFQVDGSGKLNGYSPKEQSLRSAAKQPDTVETSAPAETGGVMGWLGKHVGKNDPSAEIKKLLTRDQISGIEDNVKEGADFKVQIGDKLVVGTKVNGKLIYKRFTRIAKDDADLLKRKANQLKNK